MIKPQNKHISKVMAIVVSTMCVRRMSNVNKRYIQSALNVNGCGPDGYESIIPDFNLTQDCNWHDFFYNTKAYGLAKYALKRTRLARFYSFFTGLFGKDRSSMNVMDYNMFNDVIRAFVIECNSGRISISKLLKIADILDLDINVLLNL